MRYLVSFICLFFYTHSQLSAQCQPVLLEITTQAQIDNFSTQYPGCTRVDASIWISGKDIISLEGLSQIEIILGELKITNTSLTNFHGLHNVDSIYASVEIVQDSFISNFSGLESLKYIDRILTIYGNSSLINLEGINSLDRIRIRLVIQENQQLQTLEGLNALQYIGENFWLEDNPSLVSFEGLDQLDTVDNSFLIRKNGIQNFNGLGSLRYVGNNMTVTENHNLISFEGLQVLDYLSYLSIFQNNSLQHLEGLESIGEIEKDLVIFNNPSLTTLSGLEIDDPESLVNFSVTDNPLLSHCAIPTVCEFLEIRPMNIFGNATGCANNMEVQDICLVGTDDKWDSPIAIFPNPTGNFLSLSQPSDNMYVYISDMNGRVVMEQIKFNETLDVSFFPPGIYSLHLNDNHGYQVARVVKQ